jgi:low affinity Fe/Cu permease
MGLNEVFRRAAARVSCALGSPWAFLTAVSLVSIWAALGPVLDYSNNWQLIFSTATTIPTFLMVFILQNSQNRDTKAINIKLDELLRAIEGARTGLANVGELSDEDLAKLEREFRRLASRDSPITDLQASDVSSN